MQHTLTLSTVPAETQPEENPVFNVVIAYEDFETGKQAKRTYDFLVEHLGNDCSFSNQMWKFDVLSLPKLREIAVKDATAADIVIISCRGDELPAHVKDWIESWLAEPRSTLALVALFDRSSMEGITTGLVREYLAEVAKRGRMEFFVQPEDWTHATREDDGDSFHRKPEIGERALSTLAGVVRADYAYPRWGLNE